VRQPVISPFLQPRPIWVPNTDVFIAPSGDLIICLELSGIRAGDINVTFENQRLRVTGNRASSGVATALNVLVHEINAGPFETSLEIPPGFDLQRASSAFLNGTLRIVAPKSPTSS
jgi:HSP20 family molecular chaperone IbpA